MSQPNPPVVLENSSDQDKTDLAKKDRLLSSTEMAPVQGTVDVAVPLDVLWEGFTHAKWWPRWNKCFFWAYNRDLQLGRKLIWAFEPIRSWYLYKMFAIAHIVELHDGRKVTWEVTGMPGFYARHTYHMEDLGNGCTRFGSWEQAQGAQIRFPLTKKFWVAHFTFVKDRSLEGACRLEKIYQHQQNMTNAALRSTTNEPHSTPRNLTDEDLPLRRYRAFWLVTILILLLALAAPIPLWFYVEYMRPTQIALAPGVDVITAGGGNSLIVRDGADLMLLDTKFPPASDWLRNRLSNERVNIVVNTHYHYDHTEGNTNYPQARIYAFKTVPELMMKHDAGWWKNHQAGVPTELIDDTRTITVGNQDVVLFNPGPAHTHGDLVAYLRRGDKEIVATGDLVFHTYYPMMDLFEGGIDIPGLIKAVRTLASKYPDATFVPGHGPLATANDLNNYADYLQSLWDAVAQARQNGWTEDQGVARIDLSQWNLTTLPSYHGGRLCWATAETNIRWVYEIQSGDTNNPLKDCPF
ncbi:MAG TPA: MBL fold metallo-hydrolase [Pyrinomonadaceae bacterium]|nr:MBL fold metallo-hydrolase [Pyrinomonadaceae bacterium]